MNKTHTIQKTSKQLKFNKIIAMVAMVLCGFIYCIADGIAQSIFGYGFWASLLLYLLNNMKIYWDHA